jgi:peptidoglycan/LPS O-acetylase OafA/YrhL
VFHGIIRFILACLVMLGHFVFIINPDSDLNKYNFGYSAVLVFFVLSGYLMVMVNDVAYAQRRVSFMANRYLRVYPPFLYALIISVCIHYLFINQYLYEFQYDKIREHFNLPMEALEVFSLGNLLHNIFDLPSAGIAGNFLSDSPYVFVRYTWALIVEIKFYIIIAFVFWLRDNKNYKRNYWIQVYLLLYCLYFLYALDVITFGPMRSIKYLPFFTLGIQGYLYGKSQRKSCLSLLIIFFLLSVCQIYNEFGEYRGLNQIMFFASSIFIIKIASNFKQKTSKSNKLFFKIDKYLGELSYPIYLNHAIVAFILTTIPNLNLRKDLLWSVLVTLLISIISVYLIDRPINKIRELVRKKQYSKK